MKSFIKEKLQRSMTFEMIENLMGEEYPQSFNMEEFKKLRSFKDRVNYCNTNLQKISSGSGRIVYKIDNEKVLKLGKNQKGIAQNEVEVQWGNDYYFEEILARVLDSHPDGLWVEMELARKVTPTMFKQYFGFTNNDLHHYLTNKYNENHAIRMRFHLDPNIEKFMGESHEANIIYEFMDALDITCGDFGRLSTYGWVKREGEDRIVIIDFGLDNNVYNSYYK